MHLHHVSGLHYTRELFNIGLWEEHQLIDAIASLPLLPSTRSILILHQNLFLAAHVGLIQCERDPGLDILQSVQTPLLLRQRNIVLPTGRDGSRTHRVSCDVYHIEANLLKEIECMLELQLRFAAEADDNIGRERDPGPQFAYPRDPFAV